VILIKHLTSLSHRAGKDAISYICFRLSDMRPNSCMLASIYAKEENVMSYESMRLDFASRLFQNFDEDTVRQIVSELDLVSDTYEIKRKCTDLMIPDVIPDSVKLYIASKHIQNVSKGTLENYYRTLHHFFKTVALPIEQVTTNHIRLYLNHYKIKRDVKNNTLEGIRVCLNGFFEWCVDEEIIPKNPARRVKHIKYRDDERLPMSDLELETVRQSCASPREKAMVDFLYSTACRVSEFVALNKADINWQDRTVRIRHGKGDKARTTYLNASADVSLRAYLATRTDDSEALFVSARRPHHRLTSKAVQNEIAKIVNRCDLTVHVTPHIFRHTAASLALQRGMPIDQVQRFLGHSKIETTLRYAKLLGADVQNSHGKYVT